MQITNEKQVLDFAQCFYVTSSMALGSIVASHTSAEVCDATMLNLCTTARLIKNFIYFYQLCKLLQKPSANCLPVLATKLLTVLKNYHKAAATVFILGCTRRAAV